MTEPRRVVLCHDLNPVAFPLAAALATQVERVVSLEHGSERHLVRPDRLRDLLLKNPRFQFVVAAHVLPPLLDEPALAVRSIVPIAHPVLRMLDSVERDWNAFAAGRTVAAPAETFEAAIANGLRMHLRRYPHANFHAGFLLGGQSKVDPAEVEPLARAAAATCRLVLTDFPATVRAAIGATLAWAGITPTPDSLPEVEAPPLARTLRQWRERLTRPVFNRLCRLNEADLLLYDHVAAAIAVDPTLAPSLRARLQASVEAAAELTGHRGRERPEAEPLSRAVAVAAPSCTAAGQDGFVEPDPVLGWRLRPNAQLDIDVLGETVTMRTDESGFRPVPGQPTHGEKTALVYGCSCAFGWAVPEAATLCAGLQARLPSVRVESRAANGYGQSQNLLQLMRDLRWNAPDHVCFTWIEPHLARNVAAATQVQRQTEMAGADKRSVVRTMPRAGLGPDGEATFRDVRYSRPDLVGSDLSDFNPDPYYAWLVTAALFRRAAALVQRRGGRFFVALLREPLPSPLAGMLAADGIVVVDARANGPEYTSAFDNNHPNARAHAHYAARIALHLAADPADAARASFAPEVEPA